MFIRKKGGRNGKLTSQKKKKQNKTKRRGVGEKGGEGKGMISN
jgi:hypothetical protein